MIGTRLGHYTLQSCIGKGGMGEVYRALDTRLGRSVAIKILPPASAAREQSLRRFIQEAKTASSLNHPNIVTIHEIGDDGAVPFIVMEHIEGETLASLMNRPMALDHFLDFALQITSALAAAHQAGVVHRDIKPGNIMVTPSGLIKVVDFGLARLAVHAPADEPGDASTATARMDTPMTAPGSMIGTVGYMSPEQVEGLPVDSRSDVFSAGVVLHEMLSGRPAFRARSVIGTLSAILRDEPTALSSARPDAPPALASLVGRCMAKKPADRYANAGEVHAELLAIRQSLGAAERSLIPKRALAVALVAVLGLLIASGAFWWRRDSRQRWVRNEALPQIERLFLAQDNDAAYRLARRAMEIAPDDPQLKQMWSNLTFQTTVESDPPGAMVDFKTYSAPDAPWTSLGRTPTAEVDVPLAQLRFRVTKDGYAPVEFAPQLTQTIRFELHRTGVVPPRMVAVSGGSTEFEGRTVEVPDFLIDRFEVTNREYKRFVDAGGYQRSELWKHPFVRDGRTRPWAAAVSEMTDGTGRPGPAGWELGSYAEGEDDLPVNGVSWYEAAAYAEFAGKKLLTVYHWRRAADFGSFSDVLAVSNFESKTPVAVGTMDGIGPYGTYDMAGNVKEWCSNPTGDRRFALGGAWFEPSYQYLAPDAQPPDERRPGFGVRLMKETGAPLGDLTAEVVSKPFEIPPPVDDATFRMYARLFDYDPLPLDAKLEESDDSHARWKREKVSFAAPYGNERIPAYLYLPKNARPPYQTVVVFPGSHAITIKSSKNLSMRFADFYVKSGRAVIYPIYKGTYERGIGWLEPNAYREVKIQRVKDVRRVVDYVASRPDLDSSRLLYYGFSWGVGQGPVNLAVETRFKAAVFLAGGFTLRPVAPEFAMQNYLPHVKLPVLLVTGRVDFLHPYETSQKPFFALLGTPAQNKRHVVLAGGHLPPQYGEMVKEILAWTDTTLGPVR